MPGLTRFPKPKPDMQEQILEALKRLDEKIDELIKCTETNNATNKHTTADSDTPGVNV